MRHRLFFLFSLCCGVVFADSSIRVCYGYGCLVETEVRISEARWRSLAGMLNGAVNAVEERKMLARVVGKFYAWAGEQTPVHNDRGGNYADDGVSGKMDCIDHSTSTTRLLGELAQRRMLRWHRVVPLEVRTTLYIFEHFSAAIEEQYVLPGGEPQRYVVDSWFVDNGKPAVILPLEDWKNGAGPDV